MNWVREHFIELLAIAGAAYATARLVVALTPTPKDDKAMKDVALLLRLLAKFFGLDLKQGVEKKKEK